jgi:hypothetical protein
MRRFTAESAEDAERRGEMKKGDREMFGDYGDGGRKVTRLQRMNRDSFSLAFPYLLISPYLLFKFSALLGGLCVLRGKSPHAKPVEA